MTPAQIRIVQKTFLKIAPNSHDFSALFYDQLFAMDPETRALFRDDLKAQHAKFMKVIAEVVQLHLRALISLPVTASASGESAIPGAYWAGKMHFAYGVKPEHYATMKEALLRTLHKSLGEEFTQDAREAWSGAYDILAEAMKKGIDPEDEDLDQTRASRSSEPEEKQAESAFLNGLGEQQFSGEDV